MFGVLQVNFYAILGFCRIYHALMRLEIFEKSFSFFDYVCKHINKVTTILSIPLTLLGIGAFLIVFKDLYFESVYDTWTTRARKYKKTNQLDLSSSVIYIWLFTKFSFWKRIMD